MNISITDPDTLEYFKRSRNTPEDFVTRMVRMVTTLDHHSPSHQQIVDVKKDLRKLTQIDTLAHMLRSIERKVDDISSKLDGASKKDRVDDNILESNALVLKQSVAPELIRPDHHSSDNVSSVEDCINVRMDDIMKLKSYLDKCMACYEALQDRAEHEILKDATQDIIDKMARYFKLAGTDTSTKDNRVEVIEIVSDDHSGSSSYQKGSKTKKKRTSPKKGKLNQKKFEEIYYSTYANEEDSKIDWTDFATQMGKSEDALREYYFNYFRLNLNNKSDEKRPRKQTAEDYQPSSSKRKIIVSSDEEDDYEHRKWLKYIDKSFDDLN